MSSMLSNIVAYNPKVIKVSILFPQSDEKMLCNGSQKTYWNWFQTSQVWSKIIDTDLENTKAVET